MRALAFLSLLLMSPAGSRLAGAEEPTPGPIDVCREQKSGQIRESERPPAQAAYDEAPRYFDSVLQSPNR